MFSLSSLQIIVSPVLKSLSVSFNICFIFWSDLFFPLCWEKEIYLGVHHILDNVFIISRIRILSCKDSRFCGFSSVNIISFVSTVNFFWLRWNCMQTLFLAWQLCFQYIFLTLFETKTEKKYCSWLFFCVALWCSAFVCVGLFPSNIF